MEILFIDIELFELTLKRLSYDEEGKSNTQKIEQ